MKKPLRQQNRQIISYVPRTEPAPPEHAIKMDSFRDVWMLRGKYVAFVLMGESFLRFFILKWLSFANHDELFLIVHPVASRLNLYCK